jgi:hypothetical protein
MKYVRGRRFSREKREGKEEKRVSRRVVGITSRAVGKQIK